MSILYFSLCSPGVEAFVQNIVNECEAYLEVKCIIETGDKSFASYKIQNRLANCDALIVVMGEDKISLKEFSLTDRENILCERIRVEIVSAINLNLMIIPLFLDSLVPPERSIVNGALKQLLEHRAYRLRSGFWFEDLHQLLEDIEEELEFKKEVEKKLSQPFQFNFQDSGEYTVASSKTPQLSLGSCEPSRLDRVIDSENLILADARRQGNRTGEKKALSALGMVYARLGQTQKAIQYFQEQLEIVRELGSIEEKCDLLANLGDAFAISGNIDQARTYYQEQLFLAKSNDFHSFVGSAYNGLGFVCVKQGHISEGVECYLKALAIYRELENHEKELELLVGIGLNFQKLGELKQTIEYFENALKVSRYLENRKEEAQILVDCGEIYFQLENNERVDFYLTKALDFLKYMDGPLADSLSKRLKNLQESLNKIE